MFTFDERRLIMMLIKSRRGMSAIVTTVILVALALIAVGIVWAVIQNLIEDKAGDIGLQGKCLKTPLTITAVDCSEDDCEVSVKNTGTESTTDVKAIIGGATGEISTEGELGVALGPGSTDIITTVGKPDTPSQATVMAEHDGEYCNAVSFSGTIKKSPAA